MTGTLISAQIGSIRSLVDGSVSLTLVTPELSAGKAGELFDLRNKIAYCYISAKQIEANEKKIVDGLDPELTQKTPGQRLRGVLYRLWEQDNEGHKDSESFYRAKMELIINTYKANLNP
jgi:hypothetical protein